MKLLWFLMDMWTFLISHSQQEAFMDLVENGGGGRSGGRRQEIEEP